MVRFSRICGKALPQTWQLPLLTLASVCSLALAVIATPLLMSLLLYSTVYSTIPVVCFTIFFLAEVALLFTSHVGIRMVQFYVFTYQSGLSSRLITSCTENQLLRGSNSTFLHPNCSTSYVIFVV